ncbi:MAG: DmsE family decaheme c-type cytochrome [Burkholderiaceae bacterium]|nr:DmsE family decaheme c-type cytochrome [Burkholderiaceae bacterium]
MLTKTLLAAARTAAAVAALVALPALAQQPATPVCANCHADSHTSIALGPHGAKNDAAGTMCQACHGDAAAHAKDPMKVKVQNRLAKTATAEERTAVCMTCHAGNRQLTFWESGKHSKNDVACSNCHNIHAKAGNPRIAQFQTSTRDNEAEICGTCHQQIRAATLKPSRHPIQEGKVKCSDCHNPHGALTHAMVKQETVNQQCQSCHADKRGPYVFSHPAVTENCLSCHNPHGSSHQFLLNEKVPNLCQDCHDWSRHPGTFYGGQHGWTITDRTGATGLGQTGQPGPAPNAGAYNPSASTRLVARACLNCHNAIHGSNAPGNRGKFLIR